MMIPRSQTYREGRILYDARADRWDVWDVYAIPTPLHCGEAFEMKVRPLKKSV
jgi:hypothetical protein